MAATGPPASAARALLVAPASWRFRELLISLVVRDLKLKYQRSALGFVWTLLNPLLMAIVLVVVFSLVVRVPVERYWAFLISGYFAWNFLSQMIGAAPYVLREQAALRRSVAFPMGVLVTSAAISRLVEFAIEMAVVLGLLIAFHHRAVPASFAMLPVLLVLQWLLAVGMMRVVATAAAFFRDVTHVIPVLTLVLFYLSPVFYPAALVPEPAQRFYLLNPIAGLLTLYHEVLHEGRMPSMAHLLGVLVAAVVIAAAGHVVFRRHERTFPEML